MRAPGGEEDSTSYPQGRGGRRGHAAFWLGYTLTGSMVNLAVGLVSFKECIAQVEGDFAGILKKTGVYGVNGSGGNTAASLEAARSVPGRAAYSSGTMGKPQTQ